MLLALRSVWHLKHNAMQQVTASNEMLDCVSGQVVMRAEARDMWRVYLEKQVWWICGRYGTCVTGGTWMVCQGEAMMVNMQWRMRQIVCSDELICARLWGWCEEASRP